MGGEAQKLRFHLEPGVPEPPRPEPPRVGMWGLVVHMVLMVPLIPTTILNAIVAVLTLPYLWRALNAPGHRVTTSMGTAPVSVVVLALFLVVMVLGLALLTATMVLLARTILGHRQWRVILFGALGMLAVGAAVLVFTSDGAAVTAAVFGVYVYVAAVALGHLLWPVQRGTP